MAHVKGEKGIVSWAVTSKPEGKETALTALKKMFRHPRQRKRRKKGMDRSSLWLKERFPIKSRSQGGEGGGGEREKLRRNDYREAAWRRAQCKGGWEGGNQKKPKTIKGP